MESKLSQIQLICIENIPNEFVDELELPVNGGNVIYVESKSNFGKWLVTQGFVFGNYSDGTPKKTWEWLVVFR